MYYSESEIRFLSTAFQIETAAGPRELRSLVDVRQLGCPAHVFEKVLQDRERKMGKAFVEFRASNQSVATAVPSLEMEIAASRLF